MKWFYTIICTILIFMAFTFSAQAGSEYSLFEDCKSEKYSGTAEADLWFYDNSDAVSRYKEAVISEEFRSQDIAESGDRVILDLFSDSRYTAIIDRTSVNINGTLAIRARIEGYEHGYLIISTTEGRSLGEIEIPERGEHYIITGNPETMTHYLMEIDMRFMDKLESMPVLIPPSIADTKKESQVDGEAGPHGKDLGPSDPATIDIMIVYTPAASSWASSNESGISNTISQAMQKAQLTLDNSLTIVTMTLVHSAQVTYTESGSSYTDLDRLTYTDGYMDEVHTWRDTYCADLVGLFTYVEDTGGLGWQLNTINGLPDYAFAISRVQQASWTYTTIHEAGHNMGAHHHKQQNVQPGPGLFSYSAGWRWVGSDSNRYCSVMTYESGTYFADGQTHSRVAYFSNPSVNHMGVATGDVNDGDNARDIREVKHVIAAYRSVPDAPSGLSATAVSSSEIGISWTDNSSNETGFKIERKTGAGGTWGQITTVGANYTYYSDTGLNYNTTYYYRVCAYNNAGDSSFSNEAYDTTFDIPPMPPASLASVPFSSSQIDLNWIDMSTNETGFAVERKAGSTGTWAEITTLPAETTYYNDTGLTPVTTYYYRVSAYNDYGISPYSNETNSTTLVAYPLEIALDNAELIWNTTGTVNYTYWHGQDGDYYHGNSAGQAGAITHGEETGVMTTVEGPGDLSFYWKVSSEENMDLFIFFIDGTPQDQISGQVDWVQQAYAIEPGSHQLEWFYVKDPSGSSYLDTAYLDYVDFEMEFPQDEAVISIENTSAKGIYTWGYTESKSNMQSEKGSSWNKIFNNVTASKIDVADITGDGIFDFVALIDGYGLYYYNPGTASWTNLATYDTLDFTLARTSAGVKKQVIASFSSYGLYKYDFDASSWSSIIQYPADLLHAVNIDRDTSGIDELIATFTGINRMYLYDFNTSGFTTILMAKPSQVISADVTCDGNYEMVCVFDGIGVYMVRYIPEKNMLQEMEKTLDEKYVVFDLNDIERNHEWMPKNSRGLQWNRLTWGTPTSGHLIAAGDISDDAGAEVFMTYGGKLSFYTYNTSSWATLINGSFKRVISGRFTGGEKDDLIMCATSNGDIYLRKTSTASYELISPAGDSNAMATIR